VLKGIDGIAFCAFSEVDVVRHPLVQEVVRAYDVFDVERKAQAEKAKQERRAALERLPGDGEREDG
jgi:phosphate starvation-inducible PhoH-like protein